jgi:DNA (cytosine-5)-methyltransferase 1
MLRVFTSFSGYDSQCLALDRIGVPYDLVGWSEIDPYAIKAHNAIFPQYAERNYGDISKIDWAQVPDFDLFTYSSPCQDFSTAGLQRGGEKGSGTRSSLLWECERAIAAKRPKYLLMENVSALVSNKFIKLFNKWQRTLESYGYRNFAKVLNAKDYGVPQNRERIFVVSILDEAVRYYFPVSIPLKKRLKDVLEPVVDECYYINDIQVQKVLNSSFAQERNRLQDSIAGACLARDYKDPKLVCVGSLQGGVWDVKEPSFRIRKLTNRECFRLMGVDDADIDKIQAADISKSQQYKLAGNSIVVDVLAAIFRKMFIDKNNESPQLSLF